MEAYSNKSVLILGASELQVPAILAAKEKGIKTIVVDMDEAATGIHHADEFYNISTVDYEAVLNLSRRKEIDGIMTICSDRPMKVVAKVGRELGLNTISEDAALKATNKGEMRKALKEGGVPIPNFSIVSSEEEYREAIKGFSYPFIVKPSDNSGSRGVMLVEKEEDLLKAFTYARKNCTDGMVLVEDYMEGPEVSVEVFVDGEPKVVQITDKITTGAPHFVETGHTQPSRLDSSLLDEITAVAKAGVKALGISLGPAHVEIKVTGDGAKIVEIGARLGGDYITTDLVKLSTGVDLVEAALMSSLGEPVDLERKWDRTSAIRYFGFNSYINLRKEVIDSMERMYVNKMEKREMKSSRDREGFFIISADDFDELERKIRVVEDDIL